jgi:hypothetical protein
VATSIPAPDPAPRRHRSWAHDLVRAVVAIRATDPARVQAALTDLAGRRRWLTWLAWAAGTVALVFDGLVVLLRNWRLTLPQLLPAVWIGVMAWNLRTHVLEGREVPDAATPAVAVAVLLIAQVAYWCNATFAFALVQPEPVRIRPALDPAWAHRRLAGGLALLTGGAQAGLWLLGEPVLGRALWLGLLVMFVVQISMFIAVPARGWSAHDQGAPGATGSPRT